VKQINLVPPEYAHSRYVRRRTIAWTGMILSVCALVGALGLNLDKQLAAARLEKGRLQDKVRQQQEICSRLQAIAAEKRAIVAKLLELGSIQHTRATSEILGDIAAACDEGVFLTELGMTAAAPRSMQPPPAAAQAPGAPPPAPQAPAGPGPIRLKGYAMNNLGLTRFVSALTLAKSLRQVDLKFWRQEALNDIKLISFEIECFPGTGS